MNGMLWLMWSFAPIGTALVLCWGQQWPSGGCTPESAKRPKMLATSQTALVLGSQHHFTQTAKVVVETAVAVESCICNVYIYIYIHFHIHIRIHKYFYLTTYLSLSMYLSIYLSIYPSIYLSTCPSSVQTHMYTYTYTNAYTNTFTYTSTYLYLYTYTYTPICLYIRADVPIVSRFMSATLQV